MKADRAGQGIDEPRERFFERATDRVIRRKIGKRPLAVGSDYIARTAHAALALLAALRSRTGEPIPLAWEPRFSQAVAAIEVYPAGTLAARGLASLGYKKSLSDRRGTIGELQRFLDLHTVAEAAVETDHLLDSVLCVLGAHDFLTGQCLRPQHPEAARKEGWIWVRAPDGPR